MRLYRKAVLIVHGFTGSLYDNEYLMNYLEYDREFDVYAKTLPGHDHDRFENSKYTDWINFVDEEIETLIKMGYHSIYVVGHSMGGILASIAAIRHKEVKKLVLVNAAFDYFNFKQNKKDFFESRDFDKYKGLIDKLLRTSPKFILEFTKLVKKNRDVVENIDCDVLILQSLEDEIIPRETAEFIYNNVSSKKKHLTYLKGCSHVALNGNRKYDISQYIRCYLKGGLKWKKVKTYEL